MPGFVLPARLLNGNPTIDSSCCGLLTENAAEALRSFIYPDVLDFTILVMNRRRGPTTFLFSNKQLCIGFCLAEKHCILFGELEFSCRSLHALSTPRRSVSSWLWPWVLRQLRHKMKCRFPMARLASAEGDFKRAESKSDHHTLHSARRPGTILLKLQVGLSHPGPKGGAAPVLSPGPQRW